MNVSATGVTYRWVALLMAVVAVLGWGLFFMISTSTASVEDAQRSQITRLSEERDRLESEVKEQRARAGELAELEIKLATARDSLARTTEAIDKARTRHEEMRTALASAQTALASQRAQLASAENMSDAPEVSEKPRRGVRKSYPRRKRYRRSRRR
jgi:septal ring factor EnvC (AmiA/AmiB activator)